MKNSNIRNSEKTAWTPSSRIVIPGVLSPWWITKISHDSYTSALPDYYKVAALKLETLSWILVVWGGHTMLKSRSNKIFFPARLRKVVPSCSQLPSATNMSWFMILFTQFNASNMASIWDAFHWNSFLLHHGLGRISACKKVISRLVCL